MRKVTHYIYRTVLVGVYFNWYVKYISTYEVNYQTTELSNKLIIKKTNDQITELPKKLMIKQPNYQTTQLSNKLMIKQTNCRTNELSNKRTRLITVRSRFPLQLYIKKYEVRNGSLSMFFAFNFL